MIEIPYERLSTTALRELVEEFVTREGTDYGEEEVSHETKMTQVLTQIQNRLLVLLYDPESQVCGIFPKDFQVDFTNGLPQSGEEP